MAKKKAGPDLEFARELFGDAIAGLPSSVAAAKRDPKNLSLLIREGIQGIANGCLVEPQSRHLRPMLRTTAEAGVALFATSRAVDGPVQATLGDDELITFHSAADQSTMHVWAWIRAFYHSLLCSNLNGISTLCEPKVMSFGRSTTTGPEYLSLYADALAAFGRGTPDVVERALAAISATDPKRADIRDEEWALWLHVPQMSAFLKMVVADSGFTASLSEAVRLHGEFWSKPKRRRDWDGYVSLELTAIAVLARERSLFLGEPSPYLPLHLSDYGLGR